MKRFYRNPYKVEKVAFALLFAMLFFFYYLCVNLLFF